MAIQRLRCEWTGTGVEGPGLTTFFAENDGTVGISAAAAELFSAVKGLIPSGTTIFIPNGGDVIDEATGTLVGTWGVSTGTTVTCSGTGNFAGGVGARIVWRTGAVRGGRRVRGSTFIVPLVTGSYDSTGTLSTSALSALTAGTDAFMAQIISRARVWSRPRPGLPGAGIVIADGAAPDKVSWLRSRRT